MLILLWGNPNYIRIILNVNIVVKRINTLLDCYDKKELFVLDIFMLLRMILEGVIDQFIITIIYEDSKTQSIKEECRDYENQQYFRKLAKR